MSSAKYAFVSAYLKGAEAKVLTSEHIDRMSRISNIQEVASSVREVIEIIKDTEAGRYLEEAAVKSFDDSDRYLWRYFNECLVRLEWLKMVPDEIYKVIKAYLVKYDVINTKAVLQAVATGKKASLIPVGIIYSRGRLDEFSRAKSVNDITEVLTACQLGNYADVLRGYLPEDRKSRFVIEARLDGEYYSNLLGVSRKIPDGPLLAKAFSIIIDMANLALVNRVVIEGIDAEAAEFIISGGYLISDSVARDLLSHKLADLPGVLGATQYREIAEEIVASHGRTRSVTVIDEIVNRHKFRLLKEMLSPRVLTPLVVAWYLIIKETEIRNLRLILKAAFDAIPVEEIREYLVSA